MSIIDVILFSARSIKGKVLPLEYLILSLKLLENNKYRANKVAIYGCYQKKGN